MLFVTPSQLSRPMPCFPRLATPTSQPYAGLPACVQNLSGRTTAADDAHINQIRRAQLSSAFNIPIACRAGRELRARTYSWEHGWGIAVLLAGKSLPPAHSCRRNSRRLQFPGNELLDPDRMGLTLGSSEALFSRLLGGQRTSKLFPFAIGGSTTGINRQRFFAFQNATFMTARSSRPYKWRAKSEIAV